MWWAIAGTVSVTVWAFGLFIWWRGRRYRRVLSDEHMRELCLGIAQMASAARARTDVPILSEEDPRFLRSSEGVVLCYTIGRQNELFIHQLLMRHDGGPTTHVIAERVLALALLFVDEDGEADQVRSAGEVFEVSWRRGQEREAELRDTPASVPSDLTERHTRVRERARMLRLVPHGLDRGHNDTYPS